MQFWDGRVAGCRLQVQLQQVLGVSYAEQDAPRKVPVGNAGLTRGNRVSHDEPTFTLARVWVGLSKDINNSAGESSN